MLSGAYSLLASCSFLCLPLEHTPCNIIFTINQALLLDSGPHLMVSGAHSFLTSCSFLSLPSEDTPNAANSPKHAEFGSKSTTLQFFHHQTSSAAHLMVSGAHSFLTNCSFLSLPSEDTPNSVNSSKRSSAVKSHFIWAASHRRSQSSLRKALLVSASPMRLLLGEASSPSWTDRPICKAQVNRMMFMLLLQVLMIWAAPLCLPTWPQSFAASTDASLCLCYVVAFG